MKKAILALVLLLAAAVAASASESLVRRGTGIRTKPILGAVYELTLSVPESLKTADAKTLIEADQPMEFLLEIQSRLITRARFVEVTTEGFEKAARSGYPAAKKQAFLTQFSAIEFKKGDFVLMRYADGALATAYRTAEGAETPLGSIPGLELKKALFAIWLGDVPAQESLKKSLLATP
jgi:hypothetical protein